MEQKRMNSSILLVSLSLILVVLLLVGAFLMGQSDQQPEGIMLPDVQPEPVVDTAPEEEASEDTIRVTTENVTDMLRSLQRPAHYNQCYDVIVGVDGAHTVKTVELWVSGSLIHAEVRDLQMVKTILSDGETAWIWYDVDPNPISVTLQDATVEDLLGLPGFDYLQILERNPVLDADYLVLDEQNTLCMFVCTQIGENETDRWWINLDNGLLYQGDALENSRLVYEIKQTYFAALAEGDESFTGKFTLPDGTMPFTAAARTLQP